MCGIIAMVARKGHGFSSTDTDILTQLLILDQLRGEDSTGTFMADNAKNVHYMKVASHPQHLFRCKEWGTYKQKIIQRGRIVVGHNRAATKGSISSENAHPFHENNIILVHNGTLRGNHKNIADKEVDSHAVCHAFNEKGAEAVIPTIDGAFAFVWYNIEKQKLYAIRNSERPLHLVETEDVFYLASEPWMVYATTGRNYRKHVATTELKPGEMYEFSLDGTYKVSNVPLLVAPVANHRFNHYWKDDYDDAVELKPTPKKETGGLVLVNNPPVAVVKSTDDAAAEEGLPNLEYMPHISSALWRKGRSILIKLVELRQDSSKKFYIAHGKTMEPGLSVIDVTAQIPLNVSESVLARFLTEPVKGTLRVFMNPVGGPTIMVQQVSLTSIVDIHNGKLTTTEWDFVTENCACDTCKAQIYDEERPFTRVNRTTTGLDVTCADCVEDQLTGEKKNAFSQARYHALQISQHFSEKSANIPFSGIGPEAPPSVH
jgi:hypothetical protein